MIKVKNKSLYLPKPESLRKATEGNLKKTLSELNLTDGHYIGITEAQILSMPFNVKLKFVD